MPRPLMESLDDGLAFFGQRASERGSATFAVPSSERRLMRTVRLALCAGQVKGLDPCPHFNGETADRPCGREWRLSRCCPSPRAAWQRALAIGGWPGLDCPRWGRVEVTKKDLVEAGSVPE